MYGTCNCLILIPEAVLLTISIFKAKKNNFEVCALIIQTLRFFLFDEGEGKCFLLSRPACTYRDVHFESEGE
jgi:hypothetical protein